MIVAPNTAEVHEAVAKCAQRLTSRSLQHSLGQVALGLAVQPAACNDFVDKKRFAIWSNSRLRVLEQAKLQRFNLTAMPPAVLTADYRKRRVPL